MLVGLRTRPYRLVSLAHTQSASFSSSSHRREPHRSRRNVLLQNKRGIAGGNAIPALPTPERRPPAEPSYLHGVPLSSLLNSLLVLSVATLPSGLLGFLIRQTKKHASLLEYNTPMRWMFKKTFYDHFCIGAAPAEIQQNIKRLRSTGMSGIVLCFAREAPAVREPPAELTRDDVQLQDWTQMNLETITKLESGDFLALRCTGAGAGSINCMSQFSTVYKNESEAAAVTSVGPQLDVFHESMHRICESAVSRGVRVLIDAESSQTQRAIDHVALSEAADRTQKLMATFNTDGEAHVFNTYQMYLKANLQRIVDHLQYAVDHGYTAGIKMVRGAFIHTEPERALIHASKQATDDAYDAAVAYLLNGEAHAPAAVEQALEKVKSTTQRAPWRAELVLATHNSRSVQKALDQYLQQAGRRNTSGVQGVYFAQLMGMADEVSLKLAAQIQALAERKHNDAMRIGVFKYSIWGSLNECLLYLLRRAEENRDAVARSRETAQAMWREIVRRIRFSA